MKHLQHNNQDHVLFRTGHSPEGASGGDYLELVRTSDGSTVKVPLPCSSLQITERWNPTVPNCVSFQQRPPGFIDELRLKRDAYLQSVQATKKLHKGPKAETSSGTKKPRLSKKDLMLLKLQQLVAQKVLEQQQP